MGIGKSLFLALVSLFNRRMLWLMVWPALASLAFWGIAGLMLWGRTVVWIAAQLDRFMQPLVDYVPFDFSSVMLFSAHVMLILLFVPLVYLTALLILSIIGMDAMVDHVARHHYPELARRHGGSTAGSIWNSVMALGGLVLLFVVTLPLLLVPPLWAMVPVAVMGWVNQKILRYDALADHASPAERQEIFAAQRATLYLLGVILALIAYVPVIGLFAPMLFALAFIHLGLSALRALRGAPIEGEVVEGEVVEGEVIESRVIESPRR